LANLSARLPRNGNVVVQRWTSSLSVSCRPECCVSAKLTKRFGWKSAALCGIEDVVHIIVI